MEVADLYLDENKQELHIRIQHILIKKVNILINGNDQMKNFHYEIYLRYSCHDHVMTQKQRKVYKIKLWTLHVQVTLRIHKTFFNFR